MVICSVLCPASDFGGGGRALCLVVVVVAVFCSRKPFLFHANEKANHENERNAAGLVSPPALLAAPPHPHRRILRSSLSRNLFLYIFWQILWRWGPGCIWVLGERRKRRTGLKAQIWYLGGRLAGSGCISIAEGRRLGKGGCVDRCCFCRYQGRQFLLVSTEPKMGDVIWYGGRRKGVCVLLGLHEGRG